MNKITFICKTCRRPLDSITTEDGSSFIHTEYDVQVGDGRDHDPIPMIAASDNDVRWRCDFCHADTRLPWLFPARPMTWQGQHFDEAWTADEECASLVIARDWIGLAKRVFAGYRRAMGKQMNPVERMLMFDMWRTLEEHLEGDPIMPENAL